MRFDVTFDPILAQLGPFQIGWHGIFTALAVLAGVWLGTRRAERFGFEAEPVGALVVWAVVGGLIGARLFHVLDHVPYFLEHPLEVFAIWEGGIAVYGAFLGGIVGGLLAVWRMGLAPWPLLDAAAPAMLVGQAIGRLGCLSNGDAWGAPTGGDWGIVYWNPNDLLPRDLIGVPTHPYPLYEILAAVVALVGLWWWERRHPSRDGSTFLLAALAYAAIRFSLTFFRQETVVAWGLQEAQVVAVLTALAVGAVLVARRAALRTPRLSV